MPDVEEAHVELVVSIDESHRSHHAEAHSKFRKSTSLDDPATAQRENWSEELGKLNLWTFTRFEGHPAVPIKACRSPWGLLVNKRVADMLVRGHQEAESNLSA
jgi:hypothetical protein